MLRAEYNKDTSQLDRYGWSALHHACDAAHYCWRAAKAAIGLIAQTPPDTINSQTVPALHMPGGYTCLHLACDSSAKDHDLHGIIVRKLLQRRADVETRDNRDNTAFLLATGTGITDIATLLREGGSDLNATNHRRKNACDKAWKSSKSLWGTVCRWDERKWEEDEFQRGAGTKSEQWGDWQQWHSTSLAEQRQWSPKTYLPKATKGLQARNRYRLQNLLGPHT